MPITVSDRPVDTTTQIARIKIDDIDKGLKKEIETFIRELVTELHGMIFTNSDQMSPHKSDKPYSKIKKIIIKKLEHPKTKGEEFLKTFFSRDKEDDSVDTMIETLSNMLFHNWEERRIANFTIVGAHGDSNIFDAIGMDLVKSRGKLDPRQALRMDAQDAQKITDTFLKRSRYYEGLTFNRLVREFTPPKPTLRQKAQGLLKKVKGVLKGRSRGVMILNTEGLKTNIKPKLRAKENPLNGLRKLFRGK